jgi:hypothetical protein
MSGVPAPDMPAAIGWRGRLRARFGDGGSTIT